MALGCSNCATVHSCTMLAILLFSMPTSENCTSLLLLWRLKMGSALMANDASGRLSARASSMKQSLPQSFCQVHCCALTAVAACYDRGSEPWTSYSKTKA